MKKKILIFLAVLISACSSEDRAFKECIFELTKIQAANGRNLDTNEEWNKILKRQFYMDCMDAKGYRLSEERIKNIN